MGKEVRGRLKKEGTYVSLWLIHVDVWQIPTWYCRAIILQLKINKFNYEKSFLFCSTVHAFLCIVLCLSIKVLIFFKCFLFLLMYSLKKNLRFPFDMCDCDSVRGSLSPERGDRKCFLVEHLIALSFGFGASCFSYLSDVIISANSTNLNIQTNWHSVVENASFWLVEVWREGLV